MVDVGGFESIELPKQMCQSVYVDLGAPKSAWVWEAYTVCTNA